MVTCLKINTVMGGFKLLESHNRSVSDLYFTIFALQIIFYFATCIPYSCIIINTLFKMESMTVQILFLEYVTWN